MPAGPVCLLLGNGLDALVALGSPWVSSPAPGRVLTSACRLAQGPTVCDGAVATRRPGQRERALATRQCNAAAIAGRALTTNL